MENKGSYFYYRRAFGDRWNFVATDDTSTYDEIVINKNRYNFIYSKHSNISIEIYKYMFQCCISDFDIALYEIVDVDGDFCINISIAKNCFKPIFKVTIHDGTVMSTGEIADTMTEEQIKSYIIDIIKLHRSKTYKHKRD